MDKYLGSSGKRIWTFRINFVFLQAEKQKTSIMWRSLCTVLLATLLLSSCNRYQYPRQLVEADSLLAYSADSALLLLSQWQPKLRNASDADYHYFQLLQLAAEDKTYVIHTSDSIVRALISYYEDADDTHQLTRVYYLAGRVYRDMQRMPEALEFFHKSLELLAHTRNFQLQALISSQMGTILTLQKNYTEALDFFKQAYELDSKENDLKSQTFDLRDIANIYKNTKNYSMALQYYKEALETAQEADLPDMVGELYAQLAYVYYSQEDISQAKYYIEKSLSDVNKDDTLCVYSLAVEIFNGIGELDRAKTLLTTLRQYDNLYAKRFVSISYADIAKKEGNAALTFQYTDDYGRYTDSIMTANNSSAIAKILAMYNYNKKVEEVNRLENTNRRHKMLLIVVLLSVLIVSYIVYEAWCSQRRKQTETEINFANYRSKQNQLMQISQQAIEEKNNELSRLKQKLESKDGENLNLQKQITALESEIIIAQEEKALHEKKAEKANLTIINTELYATIRQRLHNPDMSQHLTTEEWNEMDRVVNQAFDGFSEQLRQYVPKISVHEYRVSLALKFGLKIKDIAEITSHSMQALGSTRSRLYAKAFGNKGVAADWDKFISSL